ncbi:response regulator [Rossellomorea marisflavi]|uniref:response regulator transcription factor n=1 Tax=Rossellomorea marisflavi TaxID=189381 RepID=UPI0035132644
MTDILLADDEPIILKGLQKIVDWQKLGADIVGVAGSGNELINEILEKKPQVVISDICMPGYSGIDVIKFIEENNLQIKVIFISAHQDFHYAKEALRYGAIDYIVKPIDKIHLEKVVRKTIHGLTKEQNEKDNYHKLAEFEQRKKQSELKAFFKLIIQDEPYQESLEKLKTEFKHPYFTVICMSIDQLYPRNWREKELSIATFAISNVIGELSSKIGQRIELTQSGYLINLINHDRGNMVDLAKEIRHQINKHLKLELTLSVGSTVANLKDVLLSYTDAITAMEKKYFIGCNQVITNDIDLVHSNEIDEQSIQEMQGNVLKALISLQYEQYMEKMGLLIDMVGHYAETKTSRESAISISYSIFKFLKFVLEEMDITFNEEFFDANNMLTQIHEQKTFSMLKQYLLNISNVIYDNVKQSGTSKEQNQMRLIKEYIQDHFHEQISLDKLAGLFFMNPYYFSSFFKKHTNENFKTYLTELRLKEAVKLLLQTDLMVYEIAEKVGYNNPRQFSDMFKKQFGTLPNKFRNRISE